MPQLVNAILARHHFILLGLRGQAKTRILRALTDLLDDWLPVIPGSEINDDPWRRSRPTDASASTRRATRCRSRGCRARPATSRSWPRPT
ncbi:MAG: hypothetical protein R2712_01530 [Vicinamibacterales bacterium]